MKAILMYGDMFMGVKTIDKITPEIELPISKNMSGMVGMLDIYPKGESNIRMTFKVVEFGKKYVVYQLNGFKS